MEWFIEDLASSRSNDLSPPPPPPVRKRYRRQTGRLRKRYLLTGDRDCGLGWSQIIEQRESLVLYISFNTLNREQSADLLLPSCYYQLLLFPRTKFIPLFPSRGWPFSATPIPSEICQKNNHQTYLIKKVIFVAVPKKPFKYYNCS